MKVSFVFLLLNLFFSNAFAAQCNAKIKKMHAAPIQKNFSGKSKTVKLDDYKFGVMVDGTSTYLGIQKPSGEQISDFSITPPRGAPATQLSILTPDGTQVSLSCYI